MLIKLVDNLKLSQNNFQLLKR